MLDKTRGAPLFCARLWQPGSTVSGGGIMAPGQLDRNHTGQATEQRLHLRTGPEQAGIPAVTIRSMAAPTDDTA